MNKSTPILVFRICMGVLFLLLISFLFRLQVVKGEYYQRIAESNFVRIRRIIATRGEIYDKKYRPIVMNIPSHNLYLISGKIGNTNALASFLQINFGIAKDDLLKRVFEQRFKTYEEILLADNITYETVLALSERMNYYPELVFRIGTTRNYLYPNHFTGYVGRINEDEYKLYREEDYSLNSYIGKTGLERYYEVLLRGMDGKEIVQVDAQGKSLDLFREDSAINPMNGLSLVLSIDNDLQDFASSVFPPGLRGAIIVSDIKTGGILAYVSKPDYDPNVFMQRISPEVWANLNRLEKPLLDRVIHAAYPPGSIYKPITAAMGLERGLIDRNTLLASCGGGLQIGNRFYKCWSSAGHGRTNVIDALKVSCDVFFYDLISRINLDDIQKHAISSMVVSKTGIDLPNERNGFFPTTRWYKDKMGITSSLQGYKANLAIGQGEVLNTPLQMNALYAAIARSGIWIQPHLLLKAVGRGRLSREQVEPLKELRMPWSANTIRLIQEGLWAVCNAPGGTGRALNVPGATSYGKTGSAENSMGSVTHAWFCGYIVTDKPEIVATAFFENAGGGGAVAAPVVNKIMNYYIGNLEKIKATADVPPQFRTTEEIREPDLPENGTAPAQTIPPPGVSPAPPSSDGLPE
ncbi:MAG: penicillin-binding protein 2 [Candidatus Cloacimonadaceae bacterium]|nr:penicillin-binding protein 2 [Candidatus Cloacimonadaceae bacterium]